MTLSLRIFLAYFLVIGATLYFLLTIFLGELRPILHQSLEETLVDTANLLAEVVSDEVNNHRLKSGKFDANMQAFNKRKLKATIYSLKKTQTSLHIYITNSKGIVIYSSDNKDIGKNYSRWNDIYLTLKGEYGRRTTQINPKDPTSSIMYIAAAIFNGNDIIGVISVGKPNISVQPFLDEANEKLKSFGLALIGFSFLLGWLLTLWLNGSIRKLVNYAKSVSDNSEPVSLPIIKEKELNTLATAMENMRRKLEGKDYIENYIHSLTHEMKSPIAAIKGATELINDSMPVVDRQRFVDNIQQENLRLETIVQRLLELAALENRYTLEKPESINIAHLIKQLVEDKKKCLSEKNIFLETHIPHKEILITGEFFLLYQAIENLLNNAMDFSPEKSLITITLTDNKPVTLTIADQGSGIPEYAIDKIFERFYSLPRPETGRKSTGLGLSFVQQVMELHQGQIHIHSSPQGTTAILGF